jgi:hypothetical protein
MDGFRDAPTDAAGLATPRSHPQPLEDLIETYDVDRLRHMGEPAVDGAGGYPRMPDGEVQWGARPYHAMLRLAQRWRLQVPTLRLLHDQAMAAFAEEAEIERRIQASGFADPTKPFAREPDPEDLAQLTDLRERQAALINTRGACSGAVMVMVAGHLDRFADDLGLQPPLSSHGPRDHAGHTFAGVVRAAANSFRHHDEWGRTPRLNNQQAASMIAIVELLEAGPEPKPWGGNWVLAVRFNLSGEVLRALTGGDFEALGRGVFDFAKALAP